jgi:hypothetical protein
MERNVTFGEARTILRRDVLAEASVNYYSDAELLDFLMRAAKELATSFGFPTVVGSVSVTENSASFSLPADSLTAELNEVVYDGFALELVPYRTIARYVDQPSIGQPRYYNYDVKRGNSTVYIAPSAPRASTIHFEYVQDYDTSTLDADDEVWDGLFPAYHELVVYRAGVKAFEASLEQERAAYWLQREQMRSQEFAAYLHKMPIHRLMGEEVAES